MKLLPVVPVVPAVGMPLMTPAELKVKPAGSVVPPDSAKTYGLEPPLAARLVE